MSLPTTEEIIDDISFFDDWEDKYKYIIDLGKSLPEFDDAWRTPERLVKGCQSNVWIQPGATQDPVKGEVLTFSVDSDAVIVRGLLGVVMAAYNERTPAEIIGFDIDKYFSELDLESHLSPTRGNGLRSIVGRVQAIAKASV
ncbi:Cysteine desulfuration protein SufE [Marinomonas gallaica]|uniref:Cysteine desulfuration protein SufE n=1 Tax=Marinomonas gallaica TaxID=1806667 RepID=A0A1C3JSP3_9GAMM|nr:SufE family protein [Marinomonas gallaica]MCO4785454.1 SufE family protein [Marinomonas atlantica]SBT18069.1 Cysteine desulfuration protein SufE [Marinomonas gallaica]SBT22449.1 Cysteine desulfuration protein SufE [Marinomonas gallaica]